MDPETPIAWDDTAAMQKVWRTQRAKSKLEAFWHQTAPADKPFEEEKAVQLLLVKLECWEMALRKIAAEVGPNAETAKTALDYKPPVW
jgi:hypothetical protein